MEQRPSTQRKLSQRMTSANEVCVSEVWSLESGVEGREGRFRGLLRFVGSGWGGGAFPRIRALKEAVRNEGVWCLGMGRGVGTE